MNKQDDIEVKDNGKRQLIERIEKLEIALVLITTQLRVFKEMPTSLLDTIERLLLKRD